LDRINHGFIKKIGILFIGGTSNRAQVALEVIMRLTLMQVGLRKNHEIFEFDAKAFKFAI
jgi:hypothetical protein